MAVSGSYNPGSYNIKTMTPEIFNKFGLDLISALNAKGIEAKLKGKGDERSITSGGFLSARTLIALHRAGDFELRIEVYERAAQDSVSTLVSAYQTNMPGIKFPISLI